MSRKDLTKFVRICQTAAQCFTDERNPGQLSDIIATKTCYTLILTTKAPKLVKAPQMRPQGKCRYCPYGMLSGCRPAFYKPPSKIPCKWIWYFPDAHSTMAVLLCTFQPPSASWKSNSVADCFNDWTSQIGLGPMPSLPMCCHKLHLQAVHTNSPPLSSRLNIVPKLPVASIQLPHFKTCTANPTRNSVFSCFILNANGFSTYPDGWSWLS